MKILMKNIQSIKNVGFELPDTGVVCFVGENSNGKSILSKIIGVITSKKWEDAEERVDLVRDGEDSGTFAMGKSDGYILVCTITGDRVTSTMTLVRPDGSKITRSVRQGGYLELVKEFGFIVCGNGALTLQIYETFGYMPFVNTNPDLDYEILGSFISDEIAEAFVKKYKEVTYPLLRKELADATDKASSAISSRGSLVVYDMSAYDGLKLRLEAVYSILKCLRKIELPKLNLLPPVRVIDVKPPSLNSFTFVSPIPVIGKLTSLSDLIGDITEIVEGRCPTCGTYLIDIKEDVRKYA